MICHLVVNLAPSILWSSKGLILANMAGAALVVCIVGHKVGNYVTLSAVLTYSEQTGLVEAGPGIQKIRGEGGGSLVGLPGKVIE